MTTKWLVSEPKPKDFNDLPAFLHVRSIISYLYPPHYRPTKRYIKAQPESLEEVIHPTSKLAIRAMTAVDWHQGVSFKDLAKFLAGSYECICSTQGIGTIHEELSSFEEGKAFFESNKQYLTRMFNRKYIAIWENDVLDSDTNFSSLAERVYQKLGYVSIYMPFVTKKRRILRMASPKSKRVRANVSGY